MKVEKVAKNGEKGQNSQPLSPGAIQAARIKGAVQCIQCVDPSRIRHKVTAGEIPAGNINVRSV